VILVLDSSALITLARIGQLPLLREIAETVLIPDAVYDEVVRAGPHRPGSAAVEQAQWIVRRQVSDRAEVTRLRNQVGPGEAEAIVLAKEARADAVVLDDATARQVAQAAGQTVVGLLELLLYGKERGVVNHVKPLLDQVISAGFFVDERLYRLILDQAREEPSQ
jgi:predicted nucleic acid-binding protein